ncbi:MAG TPA: hypothetical protein VLL57_01715, partial [Candidatus Binataceae bacterium]|nr:hypothetical protein [Candidatus Binataceae bacterium]
KRGEVIFHTDRSAFKFKCMARDPRVTFVVDTRKAPYKCAILKGRVSVEIKNDDARMMRMAIAYLGKKNGTAYANSMKGSEVAVVSLKPERVISWDYAKESP